MFQASFDDKNMMNAIWGKLACEILMQNWDVALEDLKRLKETIESSVSYRCDMYFLESYILPYKNVFEKKILCPRDATIVVTYDIKLHDMI